MPVQSKPIIVRPKISSAVTTVAFSQKCVIESLPDELLLEIFNITCLEQTTSGISSTTTRAVLTIAAVSRRFRAVIESSPLIWANTVDFSQPQECVEKFLRLTGQKVHIHKASLKTLSCCPDGHTTAIWQWDLLVNGRSPFLERCRALEIKSMECFWNLLQKVITARNLKNISNFQVVFGRHHCERDNTDIFDSPFIADTTYPNLTSVSLFHGSFDLPKGSFPALTTLSIWLADGVDRTRNSLMSALEWVDFLKSVPQLEHLRLVKAIRRPRQTDVTLKSSPVTLSNLKTLEIHDFQHGKLGAILDHMRVAPSCNIKIKATVRTWEYPTANGVPADYIGGLLRFLKAHYTGEDAADFGSNLFIYAANAVGGISTAGLQLLNFNQNSSYKPPTISAENVPSFELSINALCRGGPLTYNHPLYTSVHEQLATVGLAAQFASVTNITLSCSDGLFAESHAQRSFFQTFSNIRRLTLLNANSLLNMKMIQEHGDVWGGLFPKLQVLGLVNIDFKRVWNDLIGVYDFSDPIGNVLVLLERRLEMSVSPAAQIQRAELTKCRSEELELQDYLGDLGIEVLSLD